MNEFKRFYVWGMNAKFFMGLYFTAILFFVGIIRLCFGFTSIDILHLAEMLLAVMIVAFSQALLLKDSDYTKGIFFRKSLLWVALSTVLTTAFSLCFGWFDGMPAWCNAVLAILMFGGYVATLNGLKMEQEQDTVRLNQELKTFQNK